MFGLGKSRAYPERYQIVGRNLDMQLEKLGAKRFFEKGEGDDDKDVEEDFIHWKEGLWKTLENRYSHTDFSAPPPSTAACDITPNLDKPATIQPPPRRQRAILVHETLCSEEEEKSQYKK